MSIYWQVSERSRSKDPESLSCHDFSFCSGCGESTGFQCDQRANWHQARQEQDRKDKGEAQRRIESLEEENVLLRRTLREVLDESKWPVELMKVRR